MQQRASREPGAVYCASFQEGAVKRLALATISTLVLATNAFAQSPPEIPYDSVPNFFKLPPDMNFGEGAGIAVNSKGHVFVFTRSNSASGPAYGAAASQLLELG